MQTTPATTTTTVTTTTVSPPVAEVPARSWASSVSEAMTRSYQRFIESLASSSTTTTPSTTSAPSLGKRSTQVLPPSGQPHPQAPPRDLKDDKKASPPTLAGIWPGHAFKRGPVKSLCEDLIAQRGEWNGAVLYKRMRKLDGEGLCEFGEFAAYLQNHPSLRQAPVLSKLLTQLSVPPSWPVDGIAGVSPGLWQVGHLASGLARGLILTGQTYSLQQVLTPLADVDRSVWLAGVATTVMALQADLRDGDLASALGAVNCLPLPHSDGVLAQCLQLARSEDVPVSTLHRLVRLGTPCPQGYRLRLEDWAGAWFRILEAPAPPQAAIAHERHFAIGHAVGSHCAGDRHQLALLRPRLDAGPGGSDDPGGGGTPRLAPSARAGVLWALDPLKCLAAVDRDADGLRQLDAWIALEEPLRRIDAASWHRTVEALEIPFAQRDRLQRLVLRRKGALEADGKGE